ncbi:MAG: SecD/SecF family protein translocase subunit [Candidatus Peribacteria bacterium]|nr:SecD/SecF family protein translocase subunit [Candidatus Peribacteria bacterium]
MDQAKEIIGKTVELEFKLPNQDQPEEQALAERAMVAEKLHQDIKTNPEKFKELSSNRASENIFYNSIPKASLAELPLIYRQHLELLNTIEIGQTSEILPGKYITTKDSETGTEIDVNGFTFFRLSNKEAGNRDSVTLSDIIEVATELNLPFNEELEVQKSDQGIATNSYIIQDSTLLFNNGELYPNQEAYKVRIFIVAPESTLGLSEEEIVDSEENFQTTLTSIKTTLDQDKNAEIEEAQEIMNGKIGMFELKQYIPEFDNKSTDKAQSYKVEGMTYIVKITETKSINEKWFGFLKVESINTEAFEIALQSKVYYTLEETFIQDKLSRTTAQSTDGKILNGANFKYATVSNSQVGKPVVVLNFDDMGKEIFCNITSNNIGKQMAIFIGGELVTAPTIQSKICDGSAQIDGQFTPESAKELTSSLNNGALPAPLILMQEEKVSPSLGEDAFTGAVIAMGVGLALIFLYVLCMYGPRKGFITLLSLSFFTLALLAIVKVIDYALSLSGIAAIILSIGMAVDANILIYERMREEKKAGKDNRTAINIAYERSRAAIRDAQLSTGLIGLLLFMMGINMFKGFGSMLVMGVILTLLINVPLIKELLYIFYDNKKK